jgi:hypothetical protein
MKTTQKTRWFLLAVSLAALALGAGCGDDDNANPTPDNNVIGGTKGNGGNSNKAGEENTSGSPNPTDGGSDTGNQGGTGNVPVGQGGEGAVAGAAAGGETGNPIPECALPETGEDGCFNCPKTDLQYLNRCAPGDCVPFDNERLTKLNADGSLPDLN